MLKNISNLFRKLFFKKNVKIPQNGSIAAGSNIEKAPQANSSADDSMIELVARILENNFSKVFSAAFIIISGIFFYDLFL